MAKYNKTRFFSFLYSDKTWFFDQSERAQVLSLIIVIINYKRSLQTFTFQDEVGKMVLNVCEVMPGLCFVTVSLPLCYLDLD